MATNDPNDVATPSSGSSYSSGDEVLISLTGGALSELMMACCNIAKEITEQDVMVNVPFCHDGPSTLSPEGNLILNISSREEGSQKAIVVRPVIKNKGINEVDAESVGIGNVGGIFEGSKDKEDERSLMGDKDGNAESSSEESKYYDALMEESIICNGVENLTIGLPFHIPKEGSANDENGGVQDGVADKDSVDTFREGTDEIKEGTKEEEPKSYNGNYDNDGVVDKKKEGADEKLKEELDDGVKYAFIGSESDDATKKAASRKSGNVKSAAPVPASTADLDNSGVVIKATAPLDRHDGEHESINGSVSMQDGAVDKKATADSKDGNATAREGTDMIKDGTEEGKDPRSCYGNYNDDTLDEEKEGADEKLEEESDDGIKSAFIGSESDNASMNPASSKSGDAKPASASAAGLEDSGDVIKATDPMDKHDDEHESINGNESACFRDDAAISHKVGCVTPEKRHQDMEATVGKDTAYADEAKTGSYSTDSTSEEKLLSTDQAITDRYAVSNTDEDAKAMKLRDGQNNSFEPEGHGAVIQAHGNAEPQVIGDTTVTPREGAESTEGSNVTGIRVATRAMVLASKKRRASHTGKCEHSSLLASGDPEVPRELTDGPSATAVPLMSNKRSLKYSGLRDFNVSDEASEGDESMESVGECYICRETGFLVVCDYCSKEFHQDCHIPRLVEIPKGKWRCCECTAPLLTKLQRCGECKACLRKDCGKCTSCQSMAKFGGDGKIHRPCVHKQCKHMRYAAPEQAPIKGLNHGRAIAAAPKRARNQNSSDGKDDRIRKPPPGLGWTPKLVKETDRQYQCHWISPVRLIEFRRHPQACKFEELRQTFGTDEVQAWEEYRKLHYGKTSFVVEPQKYDAATHPSRKIAGAPKRARKESSFDGKDTVIRMAPPGPGWTPKPVKETDRQYQCHWISPVRNIEFTRRPQACKFEELRQTFGTNEVQAWKEYRELKFGQPTCVVSPQQYDTEQKDKAKTSPSAHTYTTSTRRENAVAPKRANKQLSSDGRDDRTMKPPPGPGWTPKRVAEAENQIHCHWVSPVRNIQFTMHPQACEFEELRRTFGADEVEAWKEYTKIKRGKGDKRVLSPQQYDTEPKDKTKTSASARTQIVVASKRAKKQSTSNRTDGPTKMPPPGPGWTSKLVPEADNQNRCHWISPVRNIEFRRHPQACEFEDLRRTFGTNEVQAWIEYRKIKRGKETCVVEAQQYDTDLKDKKKTSTSARAHVISTGRENAVAPKRPKHPDRKDDRIRKPSPGPGWTPKLVAESENRIHCHWISPVRNIEFKRHPQAMEFEELRRTFGTNEIQAWEEYRKIKKGKATYVAFPAQYDTELKDKKKTSASPSTHKTSPRRENVVASSPDRKDGGTKKPPPGPGWAPKLIAETENHNRCHWISPVRNIQFTRHTQACEFEDLRRTFGTNEVQAWKEYRKIKRGKRGASVVEPWRYDDEPNDNGRTMANVGRKRASGEVKDQAVTSAKRQRTSDLSSARTESTSRRSRDKNSGDNNLMEFPFKSHSAPPTSANGFNRTGIKIILLPVRKPKLSFFLERFGEHRVLQLESKLNDPPPDKNVTMNGVNFTLVSAKVDNDNNRFGKRNFFTKEKDIQLLYIQSRYLSSNLEEMCGFSLMKPGKVVARLAHLQSEAAKVLYIERSKIKQVKDEGHEGCGFYPEGFFGDLDRNSDSIQVRLFGPTLGLAKGMLLKKRGITCIQLPSSMMKAPPSTTRGDNWVAVIVKNFFPSDENKQVGRLLDPEEAPANSWMKQTKKELSPMYQRMLRGFGVKSQDINTYAKRSKSSNKLCHAHLKGCIDPTGKLPENRVFISGYVKSGHERELFGKVHKKVYISRSPSLEPGDAKLVSVVGSKPKDMTSEEWSMLCSYSFGTIIFPQSREFDPMPCVIAGGDLDGDDFFVLWDEKILDHLLHSKDKLTKKSRKVLHNLKLPAGVSTSVGKSTKFAKTADPKWLSKAQDLMLDFATQRAANQIVGKLWSLCLSASKKDDGEIDIYDKDAVAYAKAYKDALDAPKHGGTIKLPEHLHENLPKELQGLLRPM